MPGTACFIRDIDLDGQPAKFYCAQRPSGCTNHFVAVSDATTTWLYPSNHRGQIDSFIPVQTHNTPDADEAFRAEGYTVHPILRAEKATLVYQGDFGFAHSVVHVRDLEVRITPYAQYTQAVEATFTPKGKRNRRGMTQHYKPTLVVLEGWVDVRIPDTYAPRGDHEVSRATSFSGSWCDEAGAAVDTAIAAGARLLADYRGHNCH